MADHPGSIPTSASPPARPGSAFRLDLEQQRKRAKELKRALLAGDPAALHRVRRHHPQSALPPGRPPQLSDAQTVIARELGLSSWPKLRSHILALDQARSTIAGGLAARDHGARTLHIRCGADLTVTLRDAGFAGDVLDYADPLCQGPVTADPDWLDRRAVFLAAAYGPATGQRAEQITRDLEQAERRLREAAERYDRIVLWLERDSYDQLILVRCLAQFAKTPPARLELISVGHYPGTVRFIGLGQLPPEALVLLWNERQPLSGPQVAAGAGIWDRLLRQDPRPLAAAARAGTPGLPHLAEAVRRHCQELPWLRGGLGLTERLVLELLSDGPRTVEEVFRALTWERDWLPWLGDVMLLFILEGMKRAEGPVFTGTFDDENDGGNNGGDRRWPRERLTITEVGRAVLAGDVDFLSLNPPVRWLGGVRIAAGAPCWRWDDQAAMPVRVG